MLINREGQDRLDYDKHNQWKFIKDDGDTDYILDKDRPPISDILNEKERLFLSNIEDIARNQKFIYNNYKTTYMDLIKIAINITGVIFLCLIYFKL